MLTPSYFEFISRVKIHSGLKALDGLPNHLKGLKSRRPMIITDKGVTGAGIIKTVHASIKGSGVTAGAVFDRVPQDSDMAIVSEAARIYADKACDSIVAVGGGSVIDTAKGVNILTAESSADLMKFTGYNSIRRKLNPLIAVPTTSGTGSEVTQIAVIRHREKNIKVAFVSPFLLPDIAILDPRMTESLPPHVTASTAMDAMSHAVEAYFCLGKNPISDSAAVIAIELITGNLLNVIKKPKDREGRLALATASMLAGLAFSNSPVGMVHNIGHAVGAVCHVPHGVCMAILLPYGLEYNLHKIRKQAEELLLPLAGPKIYSDTPKKERPLKAIEYLRKLNQNLHDATADSHPRFFKEVVSRDGEQMVLAQNFKEIAKNAQGDMAQFPNPEDMDINDVINVMKHAWDGTSMLADKKKA